MLKKILPLICAAILTTACAGEPALRWIPGRLKPEINGPVFRFRAAEKDAQTLLLADRRIDVSRGIRIELEYRDDAEQTNEYPRLLAAGNLSLQLKCSPRSPDKEIKAILTGGNKKDFVQILTPSKHHWENWHHVVCTLEPENGLLTLQLDHGPVLKCRLTFPVPRQQAPLLLGASSKDHSDRGYSGLIRNVSVACPYAPGRDDGKGPVIGSPLAVNGRPVEYFTVCAIPGRHLAFPGIARLPDGQLAAVFREGEGHVCPYGRICMTLSKDGGRNWSAPFVIWDTVTDERDPSIQTLPDGRILVTNMAWKSWMRAPHTAKKYPGPTAFAGNAKGYPYYYSQYMFSADNGKTWTRKLVNAFSPHGPAFKDGYFYQPVVRRERDRRRIWMYRISADASKTERLGLVMETGNGDHRMIPACEEPHTAILPDGTLVTAIRVDFDGFMRLSFSKDEGRTWTKPVKTPVRGYPQHLLVLKDGRLLATYGYRYYPFGIRACISRDGGKTWDLKNEMILRDNGLTSDLGYPVSLELEPGRVMTVYYHITREHPSCYIEAAVYTP